MACFFLPNGLSFLLPRMAMMLQSLLQAQLLLPDPFQQRPCTPTCATCSLFLPHAKVNTHAPTSTNSAHVGTPCSSSFPCHALAAPMPRPARYSLLPRTPTSPAFSNTQQTAQSIPACPVCTKRPVPVAHQPVDVLTSHVQPVAALDRPCPGPHCCPRTYPPASMSSLPDGHANAHAPSSPMLHSPCSSHTPKLPLIEHQQLSSYKGHMKPLQYGYKKP